MLGYIPLGAPNLAASPLGGGAVTQALVQSAQFVEPDTFYTETVSYSYALVQSARFVEPDTFYTGLVARAGSLIQNSTFVEQDIFYGGVVSGGAFQLNLFPGFFREADVFPGAIITRGEAPFELPGVGRGIFADYGKRVSMSFYKQRITIGQP